MFKPTHFLFFFQIGKIDSSDRLCERMTDYLGNGRWGFRGLGREASYQEVDGAF